MYIKGNCLLSKAVTFNMLQKMDPLINLLLAFLSFSGVTGQEGPLAESPAGSFRGFWSTSYRGNNMATFVGIPYAKPPVRIYFNFRYS